MLRIRLICLSSAAALFAVLAAAPPAQAVGPFGTVVFGSGTTPSACTVFADAPEGSGGYVRARGIVTCPTLLADTTFEVSVCAQRLERNGFHVKWTGPCRQWTHTFLGNRPGPPPDRDEEFVWYRYQTECDEEPAGEYRIFTGVAFWMQGVEYYAYDESPPGPALCAAP
jgi:hypothetical protein